MKKLTSISVIIPCYNSALTIGRCLKSVQLQDDPINEVIIVDDGSSDDTVLILNRIVKTQKTSYPIIIIRQKNSGPSLARNKAAKEAKGDYLAFLDSDDEWFPQHIRHLREVLNNGKRYKILTTKYLSANFDYTGEVTFNQLLYKNYFVTPCVMVERFTFLSLGGFDISMKYAEDYFLFLNINYKHRGYVIDYLGAKNIEGKRPFGDKGLSSNLYEMHLGVKKSYKALAKKKMISYCNLFFVISFEKIKYYRRILLS